MEKMNETRLIGGDNVCDSFVCKIRDTCLYGPDCSGSCRWAADRCRACALERGCKSYNNKPRYYKEGKYFYREVEKNVLNVIICTANFIFFA